MNRLYPLAVESFLNAQISWTANTIKLVATSGYVFSASDQFLSDIPVPQRVATSPALGAKTTNVPTPGVADAADTSVTIPPASGIISALVIFQDTGAAATSRLIAYDDGSILVTACDSAIVTDTVIHIETLIASLPNGTSMTFSGGAVATLTAPAAAGQTFLSVAPLALPIAAEETAQANTGGGLPFTPAPAGGILNIKFDDGPNRIFAL